MSTAQVDWATQSLDVCLLVLNSALAHHDPAALYTAATLAACVQAEKLDAKRVAVWREGMRPYERRAEFDRQLRKFTANGQPEPEPDAMPRKLDLLTLSKTQPTPPPFIIPNWLPQSEVTLFASHGGAGKSYIALYLAVCIAAGVEFFGLSVQRRRVAFYSCEDNGQILHWRLSRICAWLDVDMAALAGRLTVWDQSHADAALMTDTRDGLQITAIYEWVRDHLGEAQVLIVDGSSDAFDGDEIRRRHVRKFVRQLRRLIPADGAVLLLAHVNALTARNADTAQAFSGSTAWHNSVRARWYLRPADGDDESDDLLLQTQKGNHSGAGHSMALRWNEAAHLFLPVLEAPTTKLDRDLAKGDELEAVFKLIEAAANEGNPLPAATSGTRTAFTVASARDDMPKALTSKRGRDRFYAHVERLLNKHRITPDEHRKAGRKYIAVLVPKPCAAESTCAAEGTAAPDKSRSAPQKAH